MAHQITDTDTVGIVAGKGWHGLGLSIEAGMTAYDALNLLGLNWQVEESDTISATFNGERSQIDCSDERKALRRSDTKQILGVVGNNYHPLQNSTLASIADGLGSDENAPKVDTAGSLIGGRKVFIALKGESTVIGGDEAYQYLILANSHDGSTSLRIHPTMTRVVCMNTYAGSESDAHLGYAWRHSSGLKMKRDEIVATLSQWRTRLGTIKTQADDLAAVEVNAERVRQIFLAVFERQVGYTIKSIPTTGIEERRKERAVAAISHMSEVFDLERSTGCRPSLWLAANAATNWVQHCSGRLEGADRAASCLLGSKAQQTSAAFSTAISVGA